MNDPTRTITLRRQFVADFHRRFRELKKIISDYFSNQFVGNFEYKYTAEKHQLFMDWLNLQEELGLLETFTQVVPFRAIPANQPWINTYIWTAYQKGLVRARSEIKSLGIRDIPSYMMSEGFLTSQLFHMPFHAESIALTFTRAFTDLKGITNLMDTQISRVLANGMSEGFGAERIARDINKTVDKVGIVRARVLARTEIVKAYNDAQLNDYQGMEEIVGEEIFLQWLTAQDERVRDPRHTSRNRKIYTKEEARKLIGEPNCRCTVLPYMVSVHGNIDPSKKGPMNPL